MHATVHKLFADPYDMPNNLDAVIRASGMTKKQVAKASGVTAETLSRHIHGKVQMTLENAEKYAEILGVNVQKVMFVNPPTLIVGETILKNDNTIERTMYNEWTTGVQIAAYVSDDLCAIENKAEKDYAGYWYEYVGALSFYLKQPILTKTVHQACVQNACLVKLADEIKLPNQTATKLLAGVLYPEPGNLYTIDSPKNGVHFRGLKVEWATPFVSALFRPELRGCTYVNIESEV
jgi:DNA-binding XRE family transcriptional regulator